MYYYENTIHYLTLHSSISLTLHNIKNAANLPFYFGCEIWAIILREEWLRNYATSRKITGSIPDEIIKFFNLLNLSSLTMALESPQPLTEMSTRNPPGG
jgi:hypothetical protein